MNGVIYARYSSDAQRDESIDGQLRECTAFAKRSGIEIIGTYIDRALSAKTDNRPEFQRMIRESAKRQFEVVLVWKLDRFARNRYDSARYKNTLRKNGVKVISATEAISEGPEGIILESVLEGYAEYYSAELAEKVVRGQTENALKCRFNGGTIPMGYVIDKDKHFQINPETAPFIKEAFELYDSGVTMKDIAVELNNKGLRNTWGTKLNINAVSKLLQNRRYIGEYKYRDIVVPDGIPALVDKELFDRIQDKIRTNKKAPAHYGAENLYILSTKLYCGKCMSFMVGESGTSQNASTYRYYKCISSKRKNGCDKKAVRKDWIEDIVIDQIVETLWDDSLINRLIDEVLRQQAEADSPLVLLKKRLAETERAINNLLDSLALGYGTESIARKIAECEAEKKEIEQEIAKENLEHPVFTREQLRFWFENFRELDPKNQRHREILVDKFVNSIILYDDKIEFFFNFAKDKKSLTMEELKESSDSVHSVPPEKSTSKEVLQTADKVNF